LKFGQTYANALRRRQPKRGNKWYLDEVVLTIKGQRAAKRKIRDEIDVIRNPYQQRLRSQ